MLAKGLKGLAAASLLISAPVFAQSQVSSAQPVAQRLSIANAPVRASAPVSARSKAAGGSGLWIIGAIGLVAGVTYALVEGDDDDRPESP